MVHTYGVYTVYMHSNLAILYSLEHIRCIAVRETVQYSTFISIFSNSRWLSHHKLLHSTAQYSYTEQRITACLLHTSTVLYMQTYCTCSALQMCIWRILHSDSGATRSCSQKSGAAAAGGHSVCVRPLRLRALSQSAVL